MKKYLNTSQIPLSVAVFLATDSYDYDSTAISVTRLIKPIRQTVLASRVSAEDAVTDIQTRVASRIGVSIHDGIEKAWKENYRQALTDLGYPASVVDKIVINPKPENLTPDCIPIYMEQRATRQFGKYKITGKYDFIAEGRLEDFKTTSVWKWVNEKGNEDYQLQGSIYRWLNPDIIKADSMAIQFFFTDWAARDAKTNPNYPQKKVEQRLVPLLSLTETEKYMNSKLAEYERYRNVPEGEIPLCTDAELWRKEDTYKYYKKPETAGVGRSTKNFSNAGDAYARLEADGNVGTVIKVPGQAIACKFCAAFLACTQKDLLIADGSLQL